MYFFQFEVAINSECFKMTNFILKHSVKVINIKQL
jgi:hypothetical protein